MLDVELMPAEVARFEFPFAKTAFPVSYTFMKTDFTSFQIGCCSAYLRLSMKVAVRASALASQPGTYCSTNAWRSSTVMS